jgi:hypothetical protein
VAIAVWSILLSAITLSAVATSTPEGTLIGPDGGTVTASDGSVMIVSPGTFSGDETVSLEPISQSTLEADLKFSLASEQLTFLEALSISTGGATFEKPVQLSTPNRLGLEAGSQVIVMEVLPNLNGAPALKLVDIANVVADQITTGSSAPFPSVNKMENMYSCSHNRSFSSLPEPSPMQKGRPRLRPL